jgi:hypothetical protein
MLRLKFLLLLKRIYNKGKNNNQNTSDKNELCAIIKNSVSIKN